MLCVHLKHQDAQVLLCLLAYAGSSCSCYFCGSGCPSSKKLGQWYSMQSVCICLRCQSHLNFLRLQVAVFPTPDWYHGSSSAHAGFGAGGWAKGTGYGGGGSSMFHMHGVSQPNQMAVVEQQCRAAASARQQVSDEHIQRSITAICNCVELATGMWSCCCYPSISCVSMLAVYHSATPNR